MAIVAVSIVAGVWQHGRHVERAQALEQFEVASGLTTSPLSAISAPGDATLAPEATWRRVEVTGHFAPGSATVLRNRPIDRVATYQYLAWFVVADGGALLVNTGWDEAPSAGGDPPIPALPQGDVTIEVILRDLEQDDGRRDAGATRVTFAQVPPAPDTPYPGYGMLRDSCDASGPCVSEIGLTDVPLPYLTTGPHLSYAWQWWAFAALAPVGAVVLLRRESTPAADVRERTKAGASKRGLSDEEVEDAL